MNPLSAGYTHVSNDDARKESFRIELNTQSLFYIIISLLEKISGIITYIPIKINVILQDVHESTFEFHRYTPHYASSFWREQPFAYPINFEIPIFSGCLMNIKLIFRNFWNIKSLTCRTNAFARLIKLTRLERDFRAHPQFFNNARVTCMKKTYLSRIRWRPFDNHRSTITMHLPWSVVSSKEPIPDTIHQD